MKGSGMPQIRSALGGWTRRITMVRKVQYVDDGLIAYKEQQFVFRGTIQPLDPRQIALKPDGQRAWTWLQVHVYSNDTSLVNDDDRLIYLGKTYKIMARLDYRLNGFMEYHLVEDYQGGAP